jgi:hypothetical protein
MNSYEKGVHYFISFVFLFFAILVFPSIDWGRFIFALMFLAISGISFLLTLKLDDDAEDLDG